MLRLYWSFLYLGGSDRKEIRSIMSKRVQRIIEEYRDNMIDRYKNGESIPNISREIGISMTTVSKIIKDSGIERYVVSRIQLVDGIEYKICSKCGISKSIEEFNRQRNARRSVCKNCISIYGKVYRDRQTTIFKSDDVEEKVCCRCGEMKSIDEYTWKQKGIRRQSWCKSCGKNIYNSYSKSYYEYHKDKIDTYRKQYYNDNIDHLREYNKRYNDKIRQYKMTCNNIKSASDIMLSHVPMILPEDIIGYKICTICKEFKSIEEYNKGQYRCRVCESITKKQWRDSNPDKIRLHHEKYRDLMSEWKRNNRRSMLLHVYEYLVDHPCVVCGEDNRICLAFHHMRGEKIDGISRMISSHYSLEDIDNEIKKCDVLCHNCHMMTHYILIDITKLSKPHARNLAYRNDYLSTHHCVDCGESRIPTLHFHHTNGDKVKGISEMTRTSSLEKLKVEISKCEVLCANCHTIRHSKEDRRLF